MLIIMFADDWANDWVGRMEEEDSNSYYYSLICCTLLNFALALTGFILFYVYYAGSGCGLHKFFISANLIICVALSVVSIIPKVQESQPRSGLLQASVVSLYLAYLTWSALNNSPYKECKPVIWGHESTSLDTQSFISLVICFAAVLYSSIRLSSKSQFEKITGVSSLGADDASGKWADLCFLGEIFSLARDRNLYLELWYDLYDPNRPFLSPSLFPLC